MHYPGGKAKTFHHVINLIPPHEVYIEPFLGIGSVMKSKIRSDVEIGLDLDERLLNNEKLINLGVRLINDDGIEFLENYSFKGHEVIYCDPPYLPSTRKRERVYRHDLDEASHIRFLDIITKTNAKIIISGYDNEIYRNYLEKWCLYKYQAKAHDGIREECLWYNFKKPEKLHDYRYLGNNFRERQTIQRRLTRMVNRLEKLSPQERSFLSEWLSSNGELNAA